MNKNLFANLIVILVFIVGAIVQFVRGKKLFAIIGVVLGIIFLIFALIEYFRNKKQ